jgi:cell division protein FtsB
MISSGKKLLFRNKYLLAILFFLVWMLFFDPKDWGLIYDRVQKLNELQESEQQLSKQITETRAELYMLKSSADNLERFAREKYLMKKDNEEVFIVKTSKN